MADHVGQRFGDYRLIRFIGQGGFGDVYLGEHLHNHTQAAVKVLKTHLNDETDLKEFVTKLKEFINEASTFSLKHPHIVQLINFGMGKNDTPFLVMDYAPNGSLRDRHTRGTYVQPATIAAYVKQLASALQYAHDQRRVHRDVKPENMLLGPNYEILLSDFGIATFAHSTYSWEEQKRTGTILYSAPEQIQRKAQPASDQYSLGAVIYEWFCGTPPFEGDVVQLMYQHLQVAPPPLRGKISTISPEIEQVVMTALAKDPNQRFASMQAFANALEQAVQQDLVKEKPIVYQQKQAKDTLLSVGTIVASRYEVMQVKATEANKNTYKVVDHEGYQRCWNCASEGNEKGDEFCIDCGAGLLDALYDMHEYSSIKSQNADAESVHGIIINTFVDHGRAYVIEQVPIENSFPNGVHLIVASDSDTGDIHRDELNGDNSLILQFQRTYTSIAEPIGIFFVTSGFDKTARLLPTPLDDKALKLAAKPIPSEASNPNSNHIASGVVHNVIARHFVRELLTPSLADVEKSFSLLPLDEDKAVAWLMNAVENANATLCKMNRRDKTNMGSTISGFMVVGDYLHVLNVGDSRTYILRGGQIYQLTTDHSLVGQLVAGGLIQPDDVYTHPQRNRIFRCLGDQLDVKMDIFKQALHPGDILLICSHGLWEMVRDRQIEKILNNAPDPRTACTQLIETANTNGGQDNISAIVIFVK